MISAEQHTASLQHSKGSLRPPLLHFRPAVSRSLVVRRYRYDEMPHQAQAVVINQGDLLLTQHCCMVIQQLHKIPPLIGSASLFEQRCLGKRIQHKVAAALLQTAWLAAAVVQHSRYCASRGAAALKLGVETEEPQNLCT